MGFRFRKSIKIAPGVRLNVGKKSVGISAGTKGARVSVNSSGRVTKSVGIPGTGLSHVSTSKISDGDQDNEKKSGCGCGCLTIIILAILINSLFSSCFGGDEKPVESNNDDTVQTIAVETIQPAENPVSTLAVGDIKYIYHVVLPDNADISGWDYTATSSAPDIIDARAIAVIEPLRIQVTIAGKSVGTATYTLADPDGNVVLTSETITVSDPAAEAAAQAEAERQAAEEAAAQAEQQQRAEQTVYITPSGKRWHLDPDCGEKNSRPVYSSEVGNRTACAKCAGG